VARVHARRLAGAADHGRELLRAEERVRGEQFRAQRGRADGRAPPPRVAAERRRVAAEARQAAPRGVGGGGEHRRRAVALVREGVGGVVGGAAQRRRGAVRAALEPIRQAALRAHPSAEPIRPRAHHGAPRSPFSLSGW
jgi:hypothetical protein